MDAIGPQSLPDLAQRASFHVYGFELARRGVLGRAVQRCTARAKSRASSNARRTRSVNCCSRSALAPWSHRRSRPPPIARASTRQLSEMAADAILALTNSASASARSAAFSPSNLPFLVSSTCAHASDGRLRQSKPRATDPARRRAGPRPASSGTILTVINLVLFLSTWAMLPATSMQGELSQGFLQLHRRSSTRL